MLRKKRFAIFLPTPVTQQGFGFFIGLNSIDFTDSLNNSATIVNDFRKESSHRRVQNGNK
jgi:hypothetical protein